MKSLFHTAFFYRRDAEARRFIPLSFRRGVRGEVHFSVQAFLVITAWISVQTVFSQTGFSEMKNPTEFITKLNQSTLRITTLTSNIIQEKNLSILSEKITTKGHFFYKKEKNLRWEYTDPFPYLIILKDDRIFIKDEDKANQFDVHSNKMFSEINNIMIGCIRGSILKDEKNFTATYFENASYYLVKLRSLAGLKEFLKEIWLYFDKHDYTISKLEMYESSGDFTKINFTDKKLNVPVPDEKFNFN
jgi:outer membrane lipoprotein-sorting protein